MSVRFGKAIFKVGFFVLLAVGMFCVVARARVEAAAGAGPVSGSVPWYRDISTVISVAALTFSFGTTAVSYRRAELQDIQSSRQELRGILQRLSAIPREMLDATKKYQGDAGAITGMSQLYNQESTVLSRQAGEIVKRLPKNVVSATECYAIAVAFQTSYNLPASKEFLQMALDKANNFNDEIGAVRSSGFLEFLTGQAPAGRVRYQEALNIFAKYPNYDPYTVASTNISTELFWGGSEAAAGNYDLAMQHADNAEKIMAGLSPSPGSDILRGQIEQAKQQFMRAVSPPTPTPPVVPTQGFFQH
jgi:tetratricopeptide (TPR) repeat protein